MFLPCCIIYETYRPYKGKIAAKCLEQGVLDENIKTLAGMAFPLSQAFLLERGSFEHKGVICP